jgi:hypothetical protein
MPNKTERSVPKGLFEGEVLAVTSERVGIKGEWEALVGRLVAERTVLGVGQAVIGVQAF